MGTTALFDLSVVLWANISGGVALGSDASDLEKLTVGHIEDGAPTLWIHFVSVILKTVVVLALLHRMSGWVAAKQRKATLARLRGVEGRTILVTDVPDGVTGARATFSALYPDAFVSAVAAVDPKPAVALTKQRDNLITALEDARFAFDKSKRVTADGVSLVRTRLGSLLVC